MALALEADWESLPVPEGKQAGRAEGKRFEGYTMSIDHLTGYIATTAIFLISLTVHEYAHAWTAYRYGDDTAARMGRLTLNPLAHISLFGTILLPLIAHFGWAKPVPVNFAVLTRSQMLKVALAGPASNLLLAVGLAVVFHVFPWRIMPIVGFLLLFAIWANIILAIFNLIPIPPLDGSRIVAAKLTSPDAIAAYRNFSQYGMLILIGLVYFRGFDVIVRPIVAAFFGLLKLPLLM
jgi:Zn-dependent protease